MSEEKEIIVYGTRWCYDTTRARRWLDSHNIQYVYIDIDQDPDARAIVEEINKGFRSVPTIVFPDGTTLTEPSNRKLCERFGVVDF